MRPALWPGSRRSRAARCANTFRRRLKKSRPTSLEQMKPRVITSTLCFAAVIASMSLVRFAVTTPNPVNTNRFVGEASAPEEPLSLWYRRPAGQWVEALAVGNGRLGAMVFGGVERERLQLNEDTLWAGGPYDPNNPEALA